MTVILVLATFLVFLLLDVALSRAPARSAARGAVPSRRPAATGPQERVVAGFRTPERLRYHSGHAWALAERKRLVRVGMDELAASLAGSIDRIELPKPGHWLRQGQRAWTLHRGSETAEMVSPIEGEVVEVNPAVAAEPSLIRKDPYGDGWLMTVYAPDDESAFRNLLPRGVVAGWMRGAAERLYALQSQVAGPVAADGGIAAVDVFSGIEGLSWSEVARQIFLGEGEGERAGSK
jgi:glycine cleavage system H lipoate-binding protein